VIGGICGAIASEDLATAEFKNHMDTLLQLFREHTLPEGLKIRALEFLTFTEVLILYYCAFITILVTTPALSPAIVSHTACSLMDTPTNLFNAVQTTSRGKPCCIGDYARLDQGGDICLPQLEPGEGMLV
jgi:hypothetical protein